MSGAVLPGAKDAMLASAVALISGQPSPEIPPTLPPGRWRRPSDLAKELGVTEAAIGRAITALGFRDQAEHRHPVMGQKRNGEGQVVCYLWSETVVDALRENFSEAGKKRAAEKRAEDDARVVEGAGRILEALKSA